MPFNKINPSHCEFNLGAADTSVAIQLCNIGTLALIITQPEAIYSQVFCVRNHEHISNRIRGV